MGVKVDIKERVATKAERYVENPEAVQRFEARKRHIEAHLQLREAWSYKQGHPETHEKYAQTAHHRFALIRMAERGEITAEQRSWAEEIAMVAEGIEALASHPEVKTSSQAQASSAE